MGCVGDRSPEVGAFCCEKTDGVVRMSFQGRFECVCVLSLSDQGWGDGMLCCSVEGIILLWKTDGAVRRPWPPGRDELVPIESDHPHGTAVST